MNDLLIRSVRLAGVLAIAVVLGSTPASAGDPARTVGFVFGSVVVIRNACGFTGDPNGLGRMLQGARLEKADISPGGQRRPEFQEGSHEARLLLTARLQRDGRDTFCSFALARYGSAGLGVVKG